MTEARYVLAALAIASAGGALLTAPGASSADSWHQVGDLNTGTSEVVASHLGLGPIYAQPVVRRIATKAPVTPTQIGSTAAPSSWVAPILPVRTVVTSGRTALATPHQVAVRVAALVRNSTTSAPAGNKAVKHHGSDHKKSKRSSH